MIHILVLRGEIEDKELELLYLQKELQLMQQSQSIEGFSYSLFRFPFGRLDSARRLRLLPVDSDSPD